MLAWERDLGLDLEHSRFQACFRVILNVSLIEVNLKVVTRRYLAPSYLAKMYPNTSSDCFRRFWNKVFSMVCHGSGLLLLQLPQIALLNEFPPRIPRSFLRRVFFILLSAKITIARAWKLPSVSLQRMTHKLSWIMLHEKIASINDKQHQFEQIWEPWAVYLNVSITSSQATISRRN